jgi:hypothetical protein
MHSFSGTYQGRSQAVELILRLDVDGQAPMNMLSGELNQTVELQEFNYFNLRQHSFIGDDVTHSQEGNRQRLHAPVRFFRLPELTGSIRVEIDPASTVARLELTGYGYHRQPFTFALQKVSDHFRTIRLEIDQEEGTQVPGFYAPWHPAPENAPAGMPEEPISIQRAFQRAGVEMVIHPAHSTLAVPGADAAWDEAELHAAMTSFFSLISGEPSWHAYLLVGERFRDPDTSGIMFDETNPLPRQGAAVFYGNFRSLPTGVRERNFLRTAVHELGHALNLLHSFQKGVLSEFGFGDNPFMLPSPEALSFMNYPWRYPYGHNLPPGWNGTQDYWSRFRFEFDDLELMHLRHHDRLEVILGGEAFGIHGHSKSEAGEPAAITAAVQRSPLRLELRAKRVDGGEIRTFELMEPVHLELKLAAKEREVPIVGGLAPEQGLVALYVQRPDGRVLRFRPLVTACTETSQEEALEPGLPRYQDLHLTYGKDGFYFQEPGIYLVRAVYLAGEHTTYSNVVPVRVATPKTAEQETLAADYFDPRKGQLLAVGPSASEQFSGEIDFFREVANRLPDSALGRALAAYLGQVDGMPFKDLRHRPARGDGRLLVERDLVTTEPSPKVGADQLQHAFQAGASPTETLSNLTRTGIALDRARILAVEGDGEQVEQAVEQAKSLVREVITGNDRLQRRELQAIDEMKSELTETG